MKTTRSHPIRDSIVSAFKNDARDAYVEQTPAGGRKIIWLALACVGCLIIWASIAQVEEVTRGDGKVIPSQSIQMVQSFDGGVIAEILTREGAAVQKDQALVRIEAVRADSQKGESVSRKYALRAKLARLLAEASSQDRLSIDADSRALAPLAVQREESLFQARRLELSSSLRVIDGQIAQRREEAREAVARRDSSVATLALLEREVNVTKPLLKTGAVSEIEIIRLERDLARSQGESAMSTTQIDRLGAAMGEARQRRLETDESFRAKARAELNETASELARLDESLKALDDRVTKTILRAPVDGIVKTLHAKSIGSVVQSGKEVVEIVPKDDTLLLEAKVNPRDIAYLHLGQHATVRLTAYDYAVHGGLSGTLEHISADTVTDEKGNAFYIVRVRTVRPAADGGGIGSKARPIIAGMTASVDVLTGKRTVLTYLLKPIMRAQAKAFTER
jgi:membrane fusion protein, adhesin transport system